ncbi:SDR family oxidoreductase [Limibacter armeniacum]|uniref:SDR family NAD(P)-dependent oxidoreductase n=1 Tax=Limibacter armeniacum TaxID=466084 RepID=UPI002FE54F0A
MQPKNAIVTGAASGIGKALSHLLLQNGYRVMLADINFTALLDEFSEVDYDSSLFHLRHLNVSDLSQWEMLIADTVDQFGEIDYLFNIAGIITPGWIEDTPLSQIDKHMDTNAKGLIYGTKLAAEVMVLQKSGHIINVSSLAGIAPIAGLSLYSASKFAVRGFTLSIAYELAPKGVNVSLVCPDLVNTPMMDLQLDYSEAALSFSGATEPLSAKQVAEAILKVMKSKEVEVCLPAKRGIMAKLGSMFPTLGGNLTKKLSSKGLKQMKSFKRNTLNFYKELPQE